LIRYALRVARHTIAFRQHDDHLNRRLFAAIERPSVPIHAVHERLLLPAAAGIATDDLRLHYHVTSEERAIASERLAALFPDEEGPLVGLQMVSFSTKSYRDWPPGHFQEFVNELRSSHPSTRFLIFGGKESRPLAKIFRRNFGLRVASLAGELSLRESAALMSLLNLYVGVDTGPTHLAGALGVPMVDLYHCRHRGHHLAPLQHAHLAVIEHPAPDDTCDTHRTMAEIGVAEVTRAARRILAETLY
jgi:heptosyltransferase-3